MIDSARTTLDLFVGNLRQVNIACIDEDDPRFVVYSVRLPSDAKLDDADLLALNRDDKFGVFLGAWLSGRAARLAVQS
jgi:hypothetical protein